MRRRSLEALLAALLLSSIFTACSEAPAEEEAPAESECQTADECPLLVCRCLDHVVPAQGCVTAYGVGTCDKDCETSCGHDGADPAHPETCIDPTDAAELPPGDEVLGESCLNSNPDQSDCDSGLCVLGAMVMGFCSAPCTSDADCGALACKAFTLGGEPRSWCILPAGEWCSS